MSSVLLDSHVLIATSLGRVASDYPAAGRLINGGEARCVASVASLWEIAIKVRLGKLRIGAQLSTWPKLLLDLGLAILPVEAHHALAAIEPEPPTRDPFDRMLLAQCAVEGMRLVTADRSLVDHPLACREDASAGP